MSQIPIPVGVPRSHEAVLTVGNFDGVHRGHAAMLAQLKKLSTQLGLPAVVVTFDPPPLAILAPDRVPPRLTTVEQKVALLRAKGVDDVIVWPASRELLSLTAEQFFKQIVRDQLKCRGIVEGPNFCFGRARAGTVELLRQLGSASDIPVIISDASESGGAMISSSQIRAALRAGDVVQASELLGRPYAITGTVISGAQRGRLLGFPTANLGGVETLIPPPGVYAGRTTIQGTDWPVALNIGPNPTFGEDQLKLEAHIVGFSGDLYGHQVAVEFLQSLRGVRKFQGVEELKLQLLHDIDACQKAFQSAKDNDAR
jgi:riboflavin kinase/FMN adenylyltransferase